MIKSWKNEIFILIILEVILLTDAYILPKIIPAYSFNIYPILAIAGIFLFIVCYPENMFVPEKKTNLLNKIVALAISVITLLGLFMIFFTAKKISFELSFKYLLPCIVMIFISIFEEIFTKKICFDYLLLKTQSKIIAFILGLLIFVLNHQYFWLDWINYVVFGLLAFICYSIFPSVILCIVFHFSWNLILFILARIGCFYVLD